MADPSGYQLKAAIKRPADTSSYGTEATSIGNQIPIVSENLTTNPELVESGASVGSASIQDVATAAHLPQGTMVTELWYEGLEYLWLAALGFESPDPGIVRGTGTDTSGSPAWNDASPESFLHVFEPDLNLHRESWTSGDRAGSSPGSDWEWSAANQKVRSFSLAIDKGVGSPSVEHFVDCMVNKFTLKGAHGRPVTVDWDIVARSRSFVGDSSGWSLPSYGPPRQAIFPQAKLYVTVPGTTLAVELPITEFELTWENNLKADDFETGQNDISAALSYRSEPVRNDARRCSLKLKFGRMNASTVTVRDWFHADTAVQAKLVLTGPSITGSSYPRRYCFGVPLAKALSAEFPTAGRGVITGDAELVAYQPSSTNYGYTWVLDEFDGVKRKKQGELFVALNNTRGSCFSRDLNTSYPLP